MSSTDAFCGQRQRLAGDGAEGREDPLSERCATQRCQSVDGGEYLGMVVRGLLRQQRSVAERHDAHLDRVGLLLDERARRGLGGVDACRLQVGGVHAVRDVEGEDDGALSVRYAEADGSGATGRTAAGPA